jgi:uncharacterized protein
MSQIFLTAEWRKLIMAQYTVDPAILAPFVPPGTEIDLYQGQCFVSLVGFLFDRVRVKRMRVPFHARFEEINLRFYVLRKETYGPYKRGVVFIREFVPRSGIALVARKFYEEPYEVLPTSHSIKRVGISLDVRYSWLFRKKWQTLSVEASQVPQPIVQGSEEAFLTEHYWGYTRRPKGGTAEYEVRHPAWQIYPITRHRIYVDFAAIFGPAFAGIKSQEPASILLAEGSPVSVMSGTRLKDSA